MAERNPNLPALPPSWDNQGDFPGTSSGGSALGWGHFETSDEAKARRAKSGPKYTSRPKPSSPAGWTAGEVPVKK